MSTTGRFCGGGTPPRAFTLESTSAMPTGIVVQSTSRREG